MRSLGPMCSSVDIIIYGDILKMALFFLPLDSPVNYSIAIDSGYHLMLTLCNNITGIMTNMILKIYLLFTWFRHTEIAHNHAPSEGAISS